MKYLNQYIERQNGWNRIIGGKELTLDTAEGRQEVADCIDCELSPENLHCDGEISGAEARRKYKFLTAVADELLKLDPSVKIWELSY